MSITTVFIDESFFELDGIKYQLIGGLFASEDSPVIQQYLNARVKLRCSTTLHYCDGLDQTEAKLFTSWAKAFEKDDKSRLGFLLYPWDNRYRTKAEYPAQQTFFFLKHLLKTSRPSLLLRVTHDRKFPLSQNGENAEKIYHKRVAQPIAKEFGCTCSFGFSVDELHDGLQFVDVCTNLINKYIRKKISEKDLAFMKLLFECDEINKSFSYDAVAPIDELIKLSFGKKIDFFHPTRAAESLKKASKTR